MRTARKTPYNPVPYLGTLTLSAGVITDATRLAGVEGDGEAYPDSSAGVWPAATNLVTNGGFETNTTGWSARGTGSSIARITSDQEFGSACLQATVTTGTFRGASALNSIAVTSGTTYTISAWLKGTAGQPIRLVLFDVAGINAVGTATLTGDWQRVTATATATGTETADIHVDTNTGWAAGGTILIDGVQVETGSIATPYIETDGGTASRSAGSIAAPAGVLDETQGWVWVRGRIGWGNSNEPSVDPALFSWVDDTNNNLRFIYTRSNNSVTCRRTAAGTSSGNPSAALALSSGAYFSAGFYWRSGILAVCANGGSWATAANTNIPTLAASTLYIGEDVAFPGRPLHGDFKWFAAGKGTLTDADAALFHAWGNNDPLPHQFPRSAQLTFLARFNADGTMYRYSA